MKKTYIAILTAAAGLCSCIEMMDSASQADVVNPLNVSFKVKAVTGFVDADGNGTINTDFPVDGLTVRFTNFEEDAVIETLTDENGIAQTEVAPGNYTISVFGESESEGNTYYLNGSVQNKAITKDITPEQAEASNDFSIAIRPAMVGPLCFSQIFYCGSTNPETQATYFRDQFYEIYNNGDETYYLDHLCFARLVPEFATATLPEWPAEDGLNNYVYAVTVWQLPGNGTDYPLKPGESFIITQEAANHADENMMFMNPDAVSAELRRQSAAKHELYQNEESLQKRLKRIADKQAEQTETFKFIRDPQNKMKRRLSEITYFRLYRHHYCVPELIALAEDAALEEPLRVAAVEALGWFGRSYQRPIISAMCERLLQSEQPRTIFEQTQRTSKRLEAY